MSLESQDTKIKVGSLFDGIGGTPLAATMSGAEPVWASEIEKIPVSITERHFPNMKHYGDITQINGAEIEPVDLIVGGSPCQDLSVAGKRAGLEGERSGLFMDQVRIVKEMRNATRRETAGRSNELPRPRYMVWENVPGAFSSNKGEDFRAVLEEIARIADDKASIPGPPKGKWSKSGSILGDGYSVAWRTVDAQHWGVPQRRRRIYLVADFGGHTAPEICFERESVSGDSEASGDAGEGVTTDVERSSGSSGVCYGVDTYNQTALPETAFTLRSASGGDSKPAVCYGIGGFNSEGMKSSNPHSGVYEADTSRTIDRNGGNPACNQGGIAVVQPEPYLIEMTSTKNTVVSGGICPTLTARMGTGGNQVNAVCLPQSEPVCFDPRSQDGVHRIHGDISPTLNTAQGGQRQPCVMSIDGDPHAVASPEQKYIVRRLTPLECERLQGFPDGWTETDVSGKTVSDTQRYKALGNSFAMPNAFFFISRVIRELRKENHEP